MHASSEPTVDTPENPNDISISDAETQSGDEHEPSNNVNDNVHVGAQPSKDNDVEIEPAVDLDNPQSKNQRYDKRDFVARKHGKEREPWVQKPMPFPPKPSKKKDDEDFERFAEMIRPIFLRMRLTDMLKMNPYAKYMKDIVTNKRKIPEAEISTILLIILLRVEYQRNLEIQEYPLYHAPLKETMLKLLYVILEPVLVLCLSLYIVDLI